METNYLCKTSINSKGSSIKDVRNQGEGVCPVQNFADKGGSSDVDICTFLPQKTLDFWKFMVCPHGQGG